MLEREVIGIDHGNRNMKTVHTDFSAAITKLEVRPDNLENVLEFQGQCFKIGEGAAEAPPHFPHTDALRSATNVRLPFHCKKSLLEIQNEVSDAYPVSHTPFHQMALCANIVPYLPGIFLPL